MPQWVAVLIAAGATILVNVLTAVYVYGQLTERVKSVAQENADHKLRLGNIETVISGTGGHGERLTALEAWRIEHRAAK